MHSLLAIFLIDDLIFLAIVMIVSATVAHLLAPKPPDQDPATVAKERSTTVERGSYTPWYRGRRRVGHSILWLGRLQIHNFSVNRASTSEYSQEGWCALAVGPGYMLRSIREGGSVIYSGWINRVTHPSGTTVRTGRFTAGPNPRVSVPETFTIYWGEDLQPVNTFLGAATRVGISSRWPSLCYVVWSPKHLGQSTLWPQLDYDLEIRCEETRLATQYAHLPGTRTLAGSGAQNIVTATNGASNTGNVTVNGNWTSSAVNRSPDAMYRPLRKCVIAGNGGAAANGEYTVRRATFAAGVTTIYFMEPLSTANNAGTIRMYLQINDDGPGPMHVFDEAMFAPWPRGMAGDSSEWDTATLNSFATTAATEKIPCSVLAGGGAALSEAIEPIMSDAGFVIGFDVKTGLNRIMPIREPSVVAAVPEEAICDPLPEITTIHQEKRTTAKAYSFQDRAKRFRTGTIVSADSSQASFDAKNKTNKVEMGTVTDFNTATIVSERRGISETSEFATYKLHMNREARYLMPGECFTADGITERLRVVDAEIDPLHPTVVINAVSDFFASVTSGYTSPAGLAESGDEADTIPPADLEAGAIPPPGGWDGGSPPAAHGDAMVFGGSGIWIPRIRATANTAGARIWVSKDDTTYDVVGDSRRHAAGGTLLGTLPNNATEIAGAGPDITLAGPDLALIRDLAGDPGWAAGEQLMVIGDEILFLEGVDVVDDETVTLRGIKRAQLGSAYSTHAIGDMVRIIQNDDVEVFRHRWIVSGETVYLKVAPFASGALDLDDITAETYVVP